MAFMYEHEGFKRPILEPEDIEFLSQKPFKELIDSAFNAKRDYYFAIIRNVGGRDNKKEFMCYDAKKICKFIFQIEIHNFTRKIRIKNFKDPSNKKRITEFAFYRIKQNSSTALMVEYVGDYKDFPDNSYLRSKIFEGENPFDCLSISFKNSKKKKKILKRKHIYSIFTTILLLVVITTFIYIMFEKNMKNKIKGQEPKKNIFTTVGIDGVKDPSKLKQLDFGGNFRFKN